MTNSKAVDIRKALTELVPFKECDRPIPAFLVELPWAATADEAAAEIAARILMAGTLDEVLDRPNAVDIESTYGVPLVLHGFQMRPSDLEDGLGAYAVIDTTRIDTGERFVTTTSALGILAQLAKCYSEGWFPFECTVQEIELNKKGRNNPRYLARYRPVVDKTGEPF